MPKRGAVESFPPGVRQMVQRKLYEGGFKDYVALAAELTAAGYPVKKSALQRYGSKLQESVKQAELEELRQMPNRAKQGAK